MEQEGHEEDPPPPPISMLDASGSGVTSAELNKRPFPSAVCSGDGSTLKSRVAGGLPSGAVVAVDGRLFCTNRNKMFGC